MPRIGGGPHIAGCGPCRWVSADKSGSMSARSSRRGLAGRVGIEAAAGAQAHQETDGQLSKGEADVDGSVTRVEGEHGPEGQARCGPQPRAAVLGSDHIAVLSGEKPAD